MGFFLGLVQAAPVLVLFHCSLVSMKRFSLSNKKKERKTVPKQECLLFLYCQSETLDPLFSKYDFVPSWYILEQYSTVLPKNCQGDSYPNLQKNPFKTKIKIPWNNVINYQGRSLIGKISSKEIELVKIVGWSTALWISFFTVCVIKFIVTYQLEFLGQ